MKVIGPSRVHQYARDHAAARTNLERWLTITKAATWRSFQELKSTFSGADSVEVQSGRIVVVFNISGNKFRLITAVHYNVQKVFVLRFLTHAQYGKGKWKEEL